MTKTPPQWQKHHHTTTKTQPHHTNTTTKTPPNYTTWAGKKAGTKPTDQKKKMPKKKRKKSQNKSAPNTKIQYCFSFWYMCRWFQDVPGFLFNARAGRVNMWSRFGLCLGPTSGFLKLKSTLSQGRLVCWISNVLPRPLDLCNRSLAVRRLRFAHGKGSVKTTGAIHSHGWPWKC